MECRRRQSHTASGVLWRRGQISYTSSLARDLGREGDTLPRNDTGVAAGDRPHDRATWPCATVRQSSRLHLRATPCTWPELAGHLMSAWAGDVLPRFLVR